MVPQAMYGLPYGLGPVRYQAAKQSVDSGRIGKQGVLSTHVLLLIFVLVVFRLAAGCILLYLLSGRSRLTGEGYG